MMDIKTFLSDKALAWRLEVRRSDGLAPWSLYATYDSLKQAQHSFKVINGAPIECKIVALYPHHSNEDLK